MQIARRVRFMAVVLSGAFIQHSVAKVEDLDEGSLEVILSAEILRPNIPVYAPSERDPFLDASVRLTQRPQADDTAGPNEDFGLDQFSSELHSELSQKCRIKGVVCSRRGNVALIGRRVLRTGDTLELEVGEGLLKKIKAAEVGGLRKLRGVLSQGVLLLKIESIGPTGMGLTHDLLEQPLRIPYSKNMLSTAAEQTTAIPK